MRALVLANRISLVLRLACVVACSDDDPSMTPDGGDELDGAIDSETSVPSPDRSDAAVPEAGRATPTDPTPVRNDPMDAAPPEMGPFTPNDPISDAGEDTEPLDAGRGFTMDAAPVPVDAASDEDASDSTVEPADAAVVGMDGATVDTPLTARLRACGIAGAGPFAPRPVQDTHDRCVQECLLDADCDALYDFECRGLTTPTVFECLGHCDEIDNPGAFACGTLEINASYVCDGLSDCELGEDEVDCAQFKCVTTGETVVGAYVRCNGKFDCSDDSDEIDCAEFCASESK